MTRTSRRTLMLIAAVALLPAPGRAQNLQHDRGTILNMDWNAFQVQIEDAKDRKRIWKVAKDATVKFSDQAWGSRGSTLKDLKTGMYVHFSYASGDPEIIQDFDVKDLGSVNKRAADAPPPPPPAPGMTSGRVTAVDLNVAQVEVMVDGAGRKTFPATNAQVLAGVKAGDRILFRTEKQANGQDFVVEVQRPRR